MAKKKRRRRGDSFVPQLGWVTLVTAEVLLGVHRTTVWRRAEQGVLKRENFHGHKCIALDSIADYLRDHPRQESRLRSHLQAWEATKEEARASGERLMSRTLARLAVEFPFTNEQFERLSAGEQRRILLAIEAEIAEARRVDDAIDTLRLAIKRNRKVLRDMRSNALLSGSARTVGALIGECERRLGELEREATLQA